VCFESLNAEIDLVSLMESLTPFQKHPVCCTLFLIVFVLLIFYQSSPAPTTLQSIFKAMCDCAV
jgi:hypothetical protein